MKILAIDTATSCGVIGFGVEGRPVAEVSLVSRENHSARLLPSIDWLLKSAGCRIEEIDAFGVTLGPGSFTGLRVGLSTVKGFAWALGKPVAGLDSLEVLASQFPSGEGSLVPMLDARKDRVYGTAFRRRGGRLETLLPPSDLSVAELLSDLPPGEIVCFGEGARRYRAAIDALGRDGVTFAPPEFDLPRGATIVRLTAEALAAGRTIDIRRAEPVYLRKSEAELRQFQAEVTR